MQRTAGRGLVTVNTPSRTRKDSNTSYLPIRSSPEIKYSINSFHTSKSVENQLIYGGLAIAGSAIALKYAISAYEAYASQPPRSPPQESSATTTQDQSSSNSNSSQSTQRASAGAESTNTATNDGASMFNFNSWFARNFYDGGFEEKMTRREAALILGVRESSSIERVKEAHRRILLLNHPDRGGSAFLSAKINEAKDLLLKGKQGQNAA